VSETTSSRTWHRLSKVLLLRKAAITFFSLAKSGFAAQNLSYSFKYIKLAEICILKDSKHQTHINMQENLKKKHQRNVLKKESNVITLMLSCL
jgi:hypothetical protein